MNHLLKVRNFSFSQLVDVDAPNALSHVQILVRRRDQVVDALVVDLSEETNLIAVSVCADYREENEEGKDSQKTNLPRCSSQ